MAIGRQADYMPKKGKGKKPSETVAAKYHKTRGKSK